ncbi:MAG: hypothetical protein RIT42_1220 [Bacteroidota bacterium]|jgi:hypothetical protein
MQQEGHPLGALLVDSQNVSSANTLARNNLFKFHSRCQEFDFDGFVLQCVTVKTTLGV